MANPFLGLEEGVGGVEIPACQAPVDNKDADNDEDVGEYKDDVGEYKDYDEVSHLRMLETRVAAMQMRNREKATFTINMVTIWMSVITEEYDNALPSQN